MNGENNFGNNNGNQFNGLNGNPNGMNNGNYFNQGMQGGMQSTPDLNNGNNMNQGMQPNMNMQQAPNMQTGMPASNGYNQPYGNMPNNGMDPNMNYNQMPMNNGFGAPQPPTPVNSNKKNTMIGVIACVGVLVLVVVIVFVVTNFAGGKKLTCEQSTSIMGIDMKMETEIKYKKKGKSTQKSTITVSQDGGFTDDEYEDIKDTFTDELDEDDDTEFVVKPKVSRKGDKIIITGTTKQDYEDKTYDDLKEQFEDAGFDCK